MPSLPQHIQQFNNNVNVLKLLDQCDPKGQYTDWKITILFYALLHRVDAVLAKQNPPIHPRNHQERNSLVDNSPGLFTGVRKDYRRLFSYSKVCRYDCDLSKVDYQKAKNTFEAALNWINSHC